MPDNVLLSHGNHHTTIGAKSFHYWVRDGIRWFQLAIVIRQTVLEHLWFKTSSAWLGIQRITLHVRLPFLSPVTSLIREVVDPCLRSGPTYRNDVEKNNRILSPFCFFIQEPSAVLTWKAKRLKKQTSDKGLYRLPILIHNLLNPILENRT